jgi:hypothetical protein
MLFQLLVGLPTLIAALVAAYHSVVTVQALRQNRG